MTRRQKIISLIASELETKITVANGYNYQFSEVYRGFKHIEEVTSFPIAMVLVEGENKDVLNVVKDETGRVVFPEHEDVKPEFLCKMNLLVVCYLERTGGSDLFDSGTLSTQSENLIKDINDYFHQYKVESCTLDDIIDIQYWHVQRVEPFIDEKSLNQNVIAFRIYIEYIENDTEVDFTTLTAPTLSTPSNSLTATTTNVAFNWAASTSALSYNIQVATDSGFNNLVLNQGSITASSFTVPTDTPLTDLTNYNWRVRAYGQTGYSDWSSTFSFYINAGSAIVPLDWNEITGSNGWWNSYSTTGNIISSGVSALLDQIGSRSLSQSTSTRRPSLSGNAYSSISSIYFNPTFASESDVLSYNDTGSAFKWGNSTTGSMILVMMSDGTNFDAQSGYFCPLSRSNTSFGNEISLIRGVNTGPQAFCLAYPVAASDYAIVPIGLNQPQHIIITHSSSSSTLYLNGRIIGAITKAFTTFSSEGNSYLVLGGYYEPAVNYASGRYTGHIFEAGFNTTVLTQAQVTASYEKFKDRFNL